MNDLLRDDRNGAILSDDRTYRYRLWRTWNASLPTCVFVMCNPSTANETEDDQTISKCINYAKRWGYGRLEVVNLFAYRTKDPSELTGVEDPIGPENDRHIDDVCDPEAFVVAAWGNDGGDWDRSRGVTEALRERGVSLYTLGTTVDGHPYHPARTSADLDPVPFGYGGDA